jgi:hypothetical protein
VRSSRRWLAGLTILGFASAQFISLAQACMSGSDGPATAAIAASAAAMPSDCPLMTDGAPSTHAVCDAHCVPREQADKGADARIALAPPSVLVVRPVELASLRAVRATPPRATIASPPLALLYSRFLI